MDNEVIKNLGELPTLVKKINAILDQNGRLMSVLSEAVNKRLEVAIPQDVLDTIAKEIKYYVKSTPCQMPDVSDISRTIASSVMDNLKATASEAVQESVREAMADTPIKVSHLHSYVSAKEMKNLVEEKTWKWLRYSLLISFILFIFVISSWISHERSSVALGQEYLEICDSEYTTKAEHQMLMKDILNESVLPIEFKKNPEYVREKIRRNQEILKQRKFDAEHNNGNYSINVPLER